MDRSRSAARLLPAALDDVPNDLDLSDTTSLDERLEALRSVGVNPGEVSSFLEGLARPLGKGETPRHRADLLLDVLEDADLCGLTTPDRRRVGPAVLEALQALGFPYALEVTPAMLTQARRTRKSLGTLPDSLLGVVLALVCMLPHVMSESHGRARFDSSLLLVPALVAAVFREGGRLWPSRFFTLLHRLANTAQWLLGGWLMFPLIFGMDTHLLWFGAVTAMSAWYLRRSPPLPPMT